MRFGLNLLYLIPGTVGGTETYAAGLLAGLAQIDDDNEYIAFVNLESAAWPLPSQSNFTRIVCPVRATSRVQRYVFEQVRLPKLLRRFGVDLVHSLGYVAPLFPPCPSIVTVPDLNYRSFGDRMPAARRLTLEFFVKQSTRRADHIITISEVSRIQIIAALGILPRRITATHLASSIRDVDPIDVANLLQRHQIDKPYIIAFSSTYPNKNIPRLLNAFVRARQDYSLPHQLVLVGHPPSDHASNRLDAVIFAGYLNESSKTTLLANAEMLVFPSTYEGFGLPVLEAQQAGVPVICSSAAALPEVAGEAAVFFDPLSVDEMAKAIGRVAQDTELQSSLRAKGFRNVSRFSWEKTARETFQIYLQVLSYSSS